MNTYVTSGNLFAVRLADNWSLFFISVNFYNCRVLLLPPQNGIQLLSSFHFFLELFNVWVFVEESVEKGFIDCCVCDSSCRFFLRTTGNVFQHFTLLSIRIPTLPSQNEIQLLSRFFCYSKLVCLFGLDWGRLRRGIQVELAGLIVQETFGASLTRF